MKPIIEVNHLSKKYKYGESQPYYTLRDSLTNFAKNPFGIGKKQDILEKDEFWALKDVSFKVNQGEAIGIIGPNGAGKSTLLKILSRITPPTSGKAILRGRVGSLLEVGTGFHQELTGGENIYLNGAILGMTRREINRKFDEIVDFSGVEKFIDTPVKHYSSGMYMRLAFAVAANLESEILIVDEVLAVGDAEFQKKCLGKMNEVTKGGRTVLFVSHNLDSIENLCSNTILLNEGSIVQEGRTRDVLKTYLKSKEILLSKKHWSDINRAPGNDFVRLLMVAVHNSDYKITDTFDIREKIGISMKYKVLKENCIFTQGLNLFNEQGVNILNSHDVISPIRSKPRKEGIYTSTAWIPGNFLSDGVVKVGVALLKQNPFEVFLHEQDAVSFNVVDSLEDSSTRGEYKGEFPGVVRPILQWSTSKEG